MNDYKLLFLTCLIFSLLALIASVKGFWGAIETPFLTMVGVLFILFIGDKMTDKKEGKIFYIGLTLKFIALVLMLFKLYFSLTGWWI